MLTRGPSCVPTDCFRRSVFGCNGRAGEHGGLPPDVAKTKDRGLTSKQVVAYTNDNTMARLHRETTSPLAATARGVGGFVTGQGATHTDPAGRAISSSDAADGVEASQAIRWSREYNDSELGPVYYIALLMMFTKRYRAAKS